MSIDFDVIVSDWVEIEQLASFVTDSLGLCVVRSTSDASTSIGISLRGNAESDIVIYGPLQVELDDLEEWACSAVLNPKWLFQVHVSRSSSSKAVAIAKKSCAFLADAGRGAACDLQEDRMFYPRKAPARYEKSHAEEERIDLIYMEFFLPFSSVTERTATALLRVLRKYCPEAVPTRFGTFEPLQRKLSGNDDSSFVEQWVECFDVEYGDMFFWKAKAPSYGGNACFSDKRNVVPNMPIRFGRKHSVTLSFDGRALKYDERWSEALVLLFQRLAIELQAFYAAAYVVRNVIAKRNSIWFDEQVRGSRFAHGRWWQGIPNKPTWLAWFDGPYAKRLSPALAGRPHVHQLPSGALFVKTSESPLFEDELKDKFPLLPPELIRTQYDGDPADEVISVP